MQVSLSLINQTFFSCPDTTPLILIFLLQKTTILTSFWHICPRISYYFVYIILSICLYLYIVYEYAFKYKYATIHNVYEQMHVSTAKTKVYKSKFAGAHGICILLLYNTLTNITKLSSK